ncbi:hypothetical protein FOXG_15183 [Fusarium oxysporum f. sp. lycopersici 4287]|uniref:Zn(2)-C6 fungal-type domain-containing protein n=1 Tax=Fusarium oxysporum f. sp. lycopersici (strain 4287 / CBS 123668 / FGSC 9935 / NRRL 34936) TaxID=426428 RepID=A0A0J9W2A8_FUSO4|nr:hypothetical protein FOXG_15183 [Fusarium oxysporum f. sp. lycopersici 4287]KNB17026.1 hypothetical protein FOXG_15183 [Fusarium oxysporum f. sp. lycopersici 4287]
MRSFPSGCWTCKLRHRKCDLQIPACRECTDRCIPCHGYGSKPTWMDGSAAEHEELERIKRAVKQHLKKLRRVHRNQSLGRDVQPERRAQIQTPPAPDATELSSPSLSEEAVDPGYDNSESPKTLVDAGNSLPLPGRLIQEEEAAQPVSPSQDPNPPYVLPPRLAFLIMYYLDHVFVWQFPYFQPRSWLGNRGWLLIFLSNGGSLSHAALALSTLHRDASQKKCSYSQEAFEFHSKALRELRKLSQHTETETLLSDRTKLAEFIAASLTLISFEVFNGAEYDWVPHLDAVTAVLAMHSPDALLLTSSSPENTLPSPINTSRDGDPHQSQADFNFLVAEALWHDILACATTGRVPRIPYRQWLEASGLEMADLMGCYNWVMIAIGPELLRCTRTSLQRSGILEISERTLERTRASSRPWAANAGASIRRNIPPAPWVSHIFALASLVLSSTIVSGPWALLPEVKDAISESIIVLRDWPQAIPLRGLVWPLYIIGCLAEPSLQGVFESLLSSVLDESGGFGNSGTVIKLLKSRWAAPPNCNHDGLELVFQTGGNVLLT